MSPETCKAGVVFVLFYIYKTQGCVQRNTSCNHIKTEGGFQFPFNCPVGGEVFVSDNENQLIAYGTVGNQPFNFTDKVLKADNHSLFTRDCQDLEVKCIVNVDIHIKEECMAYTITEKLKNPDHKNDSPTPWGLIIGVLLAVLLLIGIWLICSYISRKKRQSSAEFLRYLRTCSCLRKENSETKETRHPGGGEVTAQPNGVIRMSDLSASDPRGSGQTDYKQDGTLESVDSIDPNADGKTPQPSSLDHNQANGGIQTTKNGDISAPDVNRASYHRDINRGLRDDPGGVNNNGGEDDVRIRVRPTGCPLGDRGPEDSGDGEKPLLSDPGAAIQDSDMTGEAAALVNKRGFDPGQDSRCSTATVTDEESMLNMKNHNITIY